MRKRMGGENSGIQKWHADAKETGLEIVKGGEKPLGRKDCALHPRTRQGDEDRCNLEQGGDPRGILQENGNETKPQT